MAQFTWKPPLHRQGLAQKETPPLPEKLAEKDPRCKACPALCTGRQGKEWEALLGYGDATLGCDGRGQGVIWSRAAGPKGLACFVNTCHWKGNKEVRSKLGLLFTDQIIKCRPSVFLGFFYMVCTILGTSLCQRGRVQCVPCW